VKQEDRWITHRLYEAGTDTRIAQEMVLGIGGVRALGWLGLNVQVYHFNEGHAVFAGLERIAELMEAGLQFPDAWARVRQQTVFTTHTPVKAGNEEHALADLRRMGACLQLSGAEMRAIGGDPFNMTVAGLRLSARRERGGAAARRDLARDVEGRQQRLPHRRDHERCARADVAGPRDPRGRARSQATRRGASQAQGRTHRRGAAPTGHRARTRRVPDRLRAPRRGLQAQRSHPAR
jgi:hypothetical protein